MSKSFIFLVKSYLGNFYRHLAIFIWSHCWQGSSLVGGAEQLGWTNSQAILNLPVQGLYKTFWCCLKTTSYHLGLYCCSYLSTKELHLWDISWCKNVLCHWSLMAFAECGIVGYFKVHSNAFFSGWNWLNQIGNAFDSISAMNSSPSWDHQYYKFFLL